MFMKEPGLGLDAVDRASGVASLRPAATLICFSHLRWAFVYQRPQHLMTRAARSFRVIFFEEPLIGEGGPARLDLQPQPGGVTVAVPILPPGLGQEATEAEQRRLLDGLVGEEAGERLVFWYYTPMALGFSGHLRPDLCVYDCMDELSAFRFAPPKLKERERALLDRAGLVFTGGLSLYEAKRDRHPSVHAFPSSIDAAHFGQARCQAKPEPADQAAIPHPRLGFFGVVDERMDTALLAELAALRPDWQFVMIGPMVKVQPSELPRLPNIHWLGGKRYEDLPGYLAGWDVGLMPFAMNESTRFISPTKTPEFLAAGVPVVSTPVTDVVRSWGEPGLVEIAATAAEMAAKAEMLLSRPQAPWLERVDAALAALSWDRTWAAMLKLMNNEMEGERPSARPVPKPGEAVHV